MGPEKSDVPFLCGDKISDLLLLLFSWLWHCSTSRKVMGSRPDEVNEFFSSYLILSATLGSGVYSAPNRNEYQKQKKCFRGVERLYVRLTTSPPSVSWLSRRFEILSISQPYRPPWPIMGVALLFFIIIYLFSWTANGVLPNGSDTAIRHTTQIHPSDCLVIYARLTV
jgi:hypothetical protein